MICYKSRYRRYKIAKCLGKTSDEEFFKLFEWVKENIICLNLYENHFTFRNFYGKSKDNIYIEYDTSTFHIWISTKMWRELYIEKFNFNNDTIRILVKDILKIHLNIEVSRVETTIKMVNLNNINE